VSTLMMRALIYALALGLVLSGPALAHSLKEVEEARHE
jgi:protein SCO1/2